MGKGTRIKITYSSIVIYRDSLLEGGMTHAPPVMFWIEAEELRTDKLIMSSRVQPRVGRSLLLALSW